MTIEVDMLGAAQREWEEQVVGGALRRAPERQSLASGTGPTARLHTPADLPDFDYLDELGFPGEYPFTRGIQPTMYRSRFWTMRQYAGFGTAEESNERFRYLLSQGQTGVSVAFDLPTQNGYDSDHALAEGEVGQVGVAIDSLADMETLFAGIPLDHVSTSMTINAPAAVLLAMYLVVAERQGVPHDRIAGTTQNDILKEYVARGTYIFPPRPSLRLAADLIAYCADHLPRWNPISISGYHMRDAGCTAAQEIAFSFAHAIAYIEELIGRGIAIDRFAPQLSWIFNTQNNFLEEVAKYRALRRLWAKITCERFGARDPRSWMLRTHVQTGGATLTAQQPENNIVRAAFQALATVLGGVQSLALSCYDEALAIPTEQAQQIALRTQQIIAYETGVADTVDPLGGSYYVEYLTRAIERQAEEELARVAERGGAVAAIESGYTQAVILEQAWKHQQQIERGEQVIVGVNKFVDQEERRPPTFAPNPAIAGSQIERLARVRATRDGSAVAATLARLQEAAQGQDNLMPLIIDAVRTYATVGEICGALREVWGEYRAPSGL